MKQNIFNSKQFKKSLAKKIIGITMIAAFICTSSTTGIKAASVTRIATCKDTSYSDMGGICTGPAGSIIYYTKGSGNNTAKVCKYNTDTKKTSTITAQSIGHANDMTYYSSHIYIANGPYDNLTTGDTSANHAECYQIYRYSTSLTNRVTYKCSFTCGTIASLGNGYFIIGEVGGLSNGTIKYHIGTFNSSNTFDQTGDTIVLNVGSDSTVPDTSAKRQGITYNSTNSTLYVSIYKPNGGATTNYVYTVSLSINTAANTYTFGSDKLSKSLELSKGTTNFKKFEVESIYINNGTMYFSANVESKDSVTDKKYDGLFSVDASF